MKELKFDPNNLRYTGVIGTGGIGSGKFFLLNGDHTLGREESRSGHFVDVHDYCKQHIIMHYIRVLMGPSFSVIPIGKIGDDDTGHTLYNEMKDVGLTLRQIEIDPYATTLFSFCFYYPDGSGGNLTTDNSASARVDSEYIEKAIPEIKELGSKGIIMAAPEVPLGARQRLLELGKKYGLLCTASFTSGEIHTAMNDGILENTDLLAINLDEASTLAGGTADLKNPALIIQSAIQKLQARNKNIWVSVTAGKQGSWCWDGQQMKHFHAVNTKVVSTAGAGDAFFSGLLCGLALGFHLFIAQQFASLVAGLSVTSPHTICKELDRASLYQFLHTSDLKFDNSIIKLLED
jgi:ribokinase